MKHKKTLTLLFVVFFLMNSTIALAKDTSHLSSTPLRIVGDNNYPPYEYLDTNGTYKGFNVDIIRAIAIELGLDIDLVSTSWESAMAMLEAGQVDAIQGMTITPERDELFDFTQDIVLNTQSIFVLKDTSYVTDLNDLRGKRVSIQADDVTNEILNEWPDIIVVKKINQLDAIKAVLNGEVDAFIGNRLTGIYNIQRFDLTDSIKIVGDDLSITPYSIAVKAGDKELLTLLDSGLTAIKSNGTYDKIYKKWFGETINDITKKWKEIISVLFILLIIALLVLFVIYLWNKNLKKIVEVRTNQLNQSNRFKDKVLNNIIDGIIAFDSNFKVIQFNSLSLELLKKEINEGQDFKELIGDRIPYEALQQALSGEAWEGNLEWEFDNSSKKYVHCSLTLIKGPYEVEGYILSIIDRTIEIELYNLAKHNDKMNALGLLSSSLAHELRNPLTAIKAFIDLIPTKIQDDNFRRELFNIVPKEIQRLNDLVESLLDYSKPRVTQPKIVSLESTLSDISTMFKKRLQEKGIKVTKLNTDIEFYVDESQLKQILINIILNSVDAIGEKGYIEIIGEESYKRNTITIKDNGKGISEDNLKRLFEPFFSSKSTGYGIGLSVTDRLIRDNNGEIKILSQVGEGTTVIIYLPNR